MVQQSNDAAVKGAQIKLGREEYAENMGRRSRTNCAVLKDAQIDLGREEYATSMGQRRNDAVVVAVQIEP